MTALFRCSFRLPTLKGKIMKVSKAMFLGFTLFLCIVVLSGCCDVFPGLPWCPDPIDPIDPEPVIHTRTFNPAPITRLCPTHVGGDREFRGHGPDVEARASLERRNSNTEIWVNLYLHAKETRADWTEARGSWSRHLWTVPSGETIINIISHQSSSAYYRDTDHDLDRPSVTGGNLVRRFEIMGDTGGNDVGNCTADDVYMSVTFNQVRVKTKEIP
jgi:hypothetical protein